MTFIAPLFPIVRWPTALSDATSTCMRSREIAEAVAHLDNRLRADIGLPPLIDLAEQPHEAAARIAMLAWR
ncbi:hypothetical protein [Roseicyclus persicicus]|uniref:Uncharacterized protein n=1 Tax=Roseicyclus persicicus TaxID=2650661 RepID=A0A7X6JZB9_9RHOB|nr:hypothetical protein [Roseibacterium persicicum]NKX44653.1 hypothetical protein [Roseibacterium persicicum]